MNKISTLLCAAAAVAALSAPATAADMRMPVKAPPPIAAVFNWTGFYIGVNGGGAFGGSSDDVVVTERNAAGALIVGGAWPGFGRFGSLDHSGGFGGGQIGYNWQAPGSAWVWGIEADFQGASIKDDAVATLPYLGLSTVTVAAESKIDWFGTVRGRVGYAFDRVLVYATGGLAYGNIKHSIAWADTFPPGFIASASRDTTRAGWVVGGGVEWAFAPNWSLKGEYQFIDLGKHSLTAQETTLAGVLQPFFLSTDDVRTQFHTARLGVNYRF
jgi:outer membrane immunogenic protein